jgi:hypothetical protein
MMPFETALLEVARFNLAKFKVARFKVVLLETVQGSFPIRSSAFKILT